VARIARRTPPAAILSATSSAANSALGTALNAMKAIQPPPKKESATMQRNWTTAGWRERWVSSSASAGHASALSSSRTHASAAILAFKHDRGDGDRSQSIADETHPADATCRANAFDRAFRRIGEEWHCRPPCAIAPCRPLPGCLR
jgi:hypothetical protein